MKTQISSTESREDGEKAKGYPINTDKLIEISDINAEGIHKNLDPNEYDEETYKLKRSANKPAEVKGMKHEVSIDNVVKVEEIKK